MLSFFQNKYGLSEKGARDLQKGAVYSALLNIGNMLPFTLFILMLGEVLKPVLNSQPVTADMFKYSAYAFLICVVIYAFQYLQYSQVFVSTYAESEKRRVNLAERLRKLPLSFFGKKDISDLTGTIMEDCNVLEHAFSHALPQYYGAIISTALIIMGLFAVDWRMAIAALWVVPVAFSVIFASKNLQQRFGEKHLESSRACADGIQECLENMNNIKLFNIEEDYLEGLDEKLDFSEKMHIRAELMTGVFVIGSQAILRLGIATIALVGGSLLIKGEIDLMTYILFLVVGAKLYDPLSVTLSSVAEIFGSEIRTKRMEKIENHEIQTGSEDYSLGGYDLAFENVRFSYEEGIDVINDVSFVARQGEVTALVGPSGGGKSTVAKLMARFWDAGSGRITLGGVDISTIDPEALLENYSIVFQDVVLFNDTVMENIRLGKKDASDEEVLRVARLAKCDDFVKDLPNGYETVIGENGSRLSGGEKQRISIARAMLKDAPIILLDEVTASLDVDNETKIQSVLSELIRGKTVVVIAHRLRTVEGADKIIVLEDGRVAEQGTHDELIKSEGTYYNFHSIQKESESWRVKMT